MPARRSPGYEQARARLIASRYVRDDRPRIRVRLPRDPIVRNGLYALLLGLLLILLARLLNPV